MSAPPASIGRYQIHRELGRGMMGVVYLAHDPDLSREIALKVIQHPPGASLEEREKFEQRFFAEAKSAARLSHPGIVVVHDVGRDSNTGSLFMALQLLKGRTLETLLRERRTLPWTEALQIARSVAEALQHAHSEGVVHRDIKPANIMILPDGEAKIMDFGIAKIETSRLTATGQFIGTPMYMSPEQAQAKPVDGRSDLFSLGSVLYEMLTGAPAFGGESVTRILFQLMSQDPAPPSTLVPSVPALVEALLRRCLAKNVAQRYQSAGELVKDIDAALANQTVLGAAPTLLSGGAGETQAGPVPVLPLTQPGPTFGTRQPTTKPQRRMLAAGLGLVALMGAGWILARSLEPAPVARLVVPATAEEAAGQERSASPSPTPTVETRVSADQPAELVVDFEHSLKSGVFRLYVDNLLIVDQTFGGRVTRKIVGLEMRKGRMVQTLEVAPGNREVKVQVAWDDNVKTERSLTSFNPGGRLRLKAKVTGLRKGLSLEWN